MTPAQRAMSTWVGALARGGVVEEDDEDALAGEAVVAYVVGEGALEALRAWFAKATYEEAIRERRAAIEVCIWMAHADRDIHPEERHLLRQLVTFSGLPADEQDALVTAVHEPPSREGLPERLTQPVLRELILALAWELALADGRVDDAEASLYLTLASELEVSPDRAKAIRDAVGERIG